MSIPKNSQIRAFWFPSSVPRALPAMLFPSSLGNALFPLTAALLKEKVYPKVLIALTPHRCIYTFIMFSGPRRWERSVLGGDEEHKLLCCNFYSCFLFNGTNCILCKGGSEPKVSDTQRGWCKTRRLSPAFFSLFFIGHTEAAMPRNARLLARSFFDWFAVHCHCKFVSRTTCQMSVQKKTKKIIKIIQSSQGVII